jgi:hypothetical protein
MTPTTVIEGKTAAASAAIWRLAGHFIVRRAGFPFELLESLRFEESSRAVAKILAAEHRMEAERRRLLDGPLYRVVADLKLVPRRHRQRTVLTKIRKELQRRRTIPEPLLCVLDQDFTDLLALDLWSWNQLVIERARLEAAARQTFFLELADQRQKLAGIVRDPTFREAVFLSNPAFEAAAIDSYLENSRGTECRTQRRTETTLAAYLQRFCAKNDTASFFGPIDYALADGHGGLVIEFAQQRLRRREAFFAYWAAARLARAVSEDPEIGPSLPVRINPLCRVGGPSSVHIDLAEKTVALAPALMRVFIAARRSMKSAELARELGIGQNECEDAVRALVRGKLLFRQIEIPPGEFHPLACILRQIDALPPECPARQQWRDVMTRFENYRVRFGQAPLDERRRILAEAETDFERVAGVPARRKSGEMYADRVLLYEECLGNLRTVRMGYDLSRAVAEKLSLPLRVAAVRAQLARAALERRAGPIFDELQRTFGEVSYSRFAAALNQRLAPGDEAGEFLDRLKTAVAAAEDSGRACLCASGLGFLVQFESGSEGMFASPDFMIAAPSLEAINRGEFTLVLSEVHDNITLWDTLMYFHPDRAAVATVLEDALTASGVFPDLARVEFARENKCMALPLPGTTIELTAPAPAGAQAAPASDLVVERDSSGFAVRSRSESRRMKLYCGLTHTVAEYVLSLPKLQNWSWDPEREHTPRIEIEGVVVQRERWRCDAAGKDLRDCAAGNFELFLAAQRFRAAGGLPRHAFLRAPKEPKPIYIDFENYFLLLLLANAVHAGGELVFEEMLPSPDQLWLRDGSGRYCVEFRTTAFFY